jgi:Lon protease-like protein
MTIVPMFPLGSVLLPGTVLPLHVFEPRFRQLVEDCVAAPEHEFGVVLIERGSEVGGGDVRRAVGTMARMVQVAEMDDGRYAVLAIGTHRIEVRAWLPDDPYPRAEVEEWADDEDGDAQMEVDGVAATVRRAAAFALELGDAGRELDTELSDDTLIASYQLVHLAPLGEADRYDLLCASGPSSRLAMLAMKVAEVEQLLRFRLGEG